VAFRGSLLGVVGVLLLLLVLQVLRFAFSRPCPLAAGARANAALPAAADAAQRSAHAPAVAQRLTHARRQQGVNGVRW
jgi:hypothetical protein